MFPLPPLLPLLLFLPSSFHVIPLIRFLFRWRCDRTHRSYWRLSRTTLLVGSRTSSNRSSSFVLPSLFFSSTSSLSFFIHLLLVDEFAQINGFPNLVNSHMPSSTLFVSPRVSQKDESTLLGAWNAVREVDGMLFNGSSSSSTS